MNHPLAMFINPHGTRVYLAVLTVQFNTVLPPQRRLRHRCFRQNAKNEVKKRRLQQNKQVLCVARVTALQQEDRLLIGQSAHRRIRM